MPAPVNFIPSASVWRRTSPHNDEAAIFKACSGLRSVQVNLSLQSIVCDGEGRQHHNSDSAPTRGNRLFEQDSCQTSRAP
jgi:hypothetical protein